MNELKGGIAEAFGITDPARAIRLISMFRKIVAESKTKDAVTVIPEMKRATSTSDEYALGSFIVGITIGRQMLKGQYTEGKFKVHDPNATELVSYFGLDDMETKLLSYKLSNFFMDNPALSPVELVKAIDKMTETREEFVLAIVATMMKSVGLVDIETLVQFLDPSIKSPKKDEKSYGSYKDH